MTKRSFISKNAGFTVPEMIFASALSILVIMIVYSFQASGQMVFQNTMNRLAVQADAKNALEHISRHLRPAENFNITDAGNTLDFGAAVASRYYLRSTGRTIAGRPVFELRFITDVDADPQEDIVIIDSLVRDNTIMPFTTPFGSGVRARFDTLRETRPGQNQRVVIDSTVGIRNN